MNKVPLTLSFEEDKLEAMEIFLKKENSSVQRKMEEALKKLYEEVVPEAVRAYVDAKSGGKACVNSNVGSHGSASSQSDGCPGRYVQGKSGCCVHRGSCGNSDSGRECS